ncbi:MAG: hypothetical protein WBG63_12300, partial [Phormidesmis sp.]
SNLLHYPFFIHNSLETYKFRDNLHGLSLVAGDHIYETVRLSAGTAHLSEYLQPEQRRED